MATVVADAPPPLTRGEAPEKGSGSKNKKRLVWGTAFVAAAALLALALLAIGKATEMSTITVSPTMIHGQVASGFEAVEAQFRKNFAERGEVGAATTVYYRGTKVVDLWGGYRDRDSEAPWDEDTMEIVFSTTKGMSAIALAMLNSRGY